MLNNKLKGLEGMNKMTRKHDQISLVTSVKKNSDYLEHLKRGFPSQPHHHTCLGFSKVPKWGFSVSRQLPPPLPGHCSWQYSSNNWLCLLLSFDGTTIAFQLVLLKNILKFATRQASASLSLSSPLLHSINLIVLACVCLSVFFTIHISWPK